MNMNTHITSNDVLRQNINAVEGTVTLCTDEPLLLDSGAKIGPIDIAYNTYGRLNADKSNAIVVCHALTGDQYAVLPHPMTGKPGWWSNLIGQGKIIDTDKYFVICSNVLGSCMGTTGPSSINPETGHPYMLDFPVITVGDMVKPQVLLLDHFGIDQAFAVIGGSMGGMQTLEWAARYPERVFCALPIATCARYSAQNIAFDEVGRQAIMADPDWCEGRYLLEDKNPRKGLAVARMTAHITYLSEAALTQKFGRKLQDREKIGYGFDADFKVESYLRYQGNAFVERFDANTYLYITRAMDYFDMSSAHNGLLAKAFHDTPVHFCVISFSSDWLFPTRDSQMIVRALNAAAASVSFVEVQSDKGHDAFLLDEPEFHDTLRGFFAGMVERRGLTFETGASA